MTRASRPFLTLTVEAVDDGKRLQSILRSRYGVSSAMIRRLKHDQCAYVNDQSVKMTDRVEAGDYVKLSYRPGGESIVIPEKRPLKIIFEDADMIVLEKPAGMLVHPSGNTLTGTMANAVAAHLLARNEPSMAGPVTRLDRNTSGIVLFAKHPHAHHRLSESISRGELIRRYIALVTGGNLPDMDTISAPIRRVEGSTVLREVGEGGQHATTQYMVKERFPSGVTLCVVTLDTGRTHQIRVHFKHIGHPLIGDPDYGIVRPGLIQRQALHASELQIPHPIDERIMSFTSDTPTDIDSAIGKLRS